MTDQRMDKAEPQSLKLRHKLGLALLVIGVLAIPCIRIFDPSYWHHLFGW
ncbi:MAG: hypothetical protein V1853_05515 [bacterium]